MSTTEFTTIQILARKWDVSESTIRRLIDEGELTGTKIRKTFKIYKESADRYLSKNKF